MKYMKLFIASIFMMVALMTNAQSTPNVTQEQHQQKQRIKEGVQSGKLTKAEARRLRKEQRRIARDKKMAKADGVVTRAERKRLRREQRAASRHIAKEKHD